MESRDGYVAAPNSGRVARARRPPALCRRRNQLTPGEWGFREARRRDRECSPQGRVHAAAAHSLPGDGNPHAVWRECHVPPSVRSRGVPGRSARMIMEIPGESKRTVS
jgi:predicted component of type VI protein secretion system